MYTKEEKEKYRGFTIFRRQNTDFYLVKEYPALALGSLEAIKKAVDILLEQQDRGQIWKEKECHTIPAQDSRAHRLKDCPCKPVQIGNEIIHNKFKK